MIYTENDLKLMDDILKLLLKYNSLSGKVNLISKDLNLSIDYTQFYLNEICANVPENNTFLVFEKSNSGRCYIVRVDKIRINLFLKSGGFKSLLNQKIVKNKNNIFIRIWNLISENKLISGLILLILAIIFKKYKFLF